MSSFIYSVSSTLVGFTLGVVLGAEQELIRSGKHYMIFRPSWLYESLPFMVRNGKAMMMGKQPMLFHWAAADDLGRMVATAYLKPEATNKIFLDEKIPYRSYRKK